MAWKKDFLLCMQRTLKTVPLGGGTASSGGSTLMNFDDCRLAYRSKTTRELLRSLLVLGFCKREFLVDHSEKFVKIGKRVLGNTLFNKLMKASFFGQFVAGENEEEIKPFIHRIRSNFGVNVILNYAVEDDEQGGEQEKSGLIKHETGKSVRQDRREQTMYSFIKTIDQVEQTTACDGFAAIKVTALAKPETLMAVTDMVERWERAMEPGKYSGEPGKLSGEDILAQLATPENGGFGSQKSLDAKLSGVRDLIRRMETIAKHADERNVRVLVDAEQTYFQPAIARLSLQLMRRYNLEKPIIYNTYQCYLKRTLKDVTAHLSLSKKENFYFGGKIVRGAYIVLERERASSMGYPDPINSTFEATTAMYKSVVQTMLEDMKAREGKTHIVIAGHNEETVHWAVSEIRRLQLPVRSRQIYFGQLLGMCDHLSFTLADAGFNVVKCVPYGSVDEVLPYLVRRAQENRGFLEKTVKERRLMREELRRRLKSGELLFNPDNPQPVGA